MVALGQFGCLQGRVLFDHIGVERFLLFFQPRHFDFDHTRAIGQIFDFHLDQCATLGHFSHSRLGFTRTILPRTDLRAGDSFLFFYLG